MKADATAGDTHRVETCVRKLWLFGVDCNEAYVITRTKQTVHISVMGSLKLGLPGKSPNQLIYNIPG